ncbi:MAG: hypothetical protein ACI4AB_09155 [Acetatifactor sp.]
MNRADIIQRLKEIKFDAGEYWVITGAAMVLYGIKEVTSDIDLGCSKKMADELEEKGYGVTLLDDGTRRIQFQDDIEIFENWLFDKVQMIENIPVVSIDGLVAMKKALGREKDFEDIRRIEVYKEKRKLPPKMRKGGICT